MLAAAAALALAWGQWLLPSRPPVGGRAAGRSVSTTACRRVLAVIHPGRGFVTVRLLRLRLLRLLLRLLLRHQAGGQGC